PTEIVIEFRLLRREIGSTLRRHLSNADPTRDVIGAELVVNDAIDGAISYGLTALMTRIHELRQDTLTTVVHELRQPITALKGWAQIVERQLESSDPDFERARGASRRICREVDRLSEIVNLQVDTTRIALGKFSLEPTETNLVELLDQAVDGFGDEVAGRVRVDIPPDVDTGGYWDPNRIGQVLRNVLANAVKYSPPGTPIDILVERSDNSGDIVVRVRDQGFGMESSELTRIFDHRHRGEEAIAHGIQGWGIGLFLCRGIVDAHGGRIWAESAGPGRGTTIHLVLPRQVPE
ncbi:MAG TPA: HAMP domain-containing sensor histidine kinase, partial [Thermomicrobiaceae bacterium]|nr:HAMP domain-containing sensor histidine kinase [Thermomicrobiaceae bacterium]